MFEYFLKYFALLIKHAKFRFNYYMVGLVRELSMPMNNNSVTIINGK